MQLNSVILTVCKLAKGTRHADNNYRFKKMGYFAQEPLV